MIENKPRVSSTAPSARRFAAMLPASIVLGACLIAGSLHPRRAAAAGPRIEVSPARLDFGDRGHNERPEAALTLRNAGDQELQILKVEVSCDCIQVTPREPMRIARGEAASLKVSMGSGRAMGLLAKKITLSTSDPDHPRVDIPVSMAVLEGYELKPSSIQFIGVVGGKPVEAAVEIVRRGSPAGAAPGSDLKLEVTEIAGLFGLSRAEHFKSAIEPIPGGRRLTVTLDPAHSEGRIAAEVRARVDGKNLIVPVAGEMFAWILVQPNFINFSPARLDDPSTRRREARLTSTDETPFSILKVEQAPSRPDDRGAALEFEVSSAPSKRAHRLTVRLERGEAPEAGSRNQSFFGKIIVTTDHPKKPQITLSYSGFFARQE